MPIHAGRRERRRLALLVAVTTLAALAGSWAATEPASGRPSAPWRASRPIALDPDLGLFGQFGYAPPYTRNVPSFDALNRPYIRSRSADPDYTAYVHTLRDGRWVRLDLVRWVRLAHPDFVATSGGASRPDDRVVFDESDRAYTLLTVRLESGEARNLMLWSEDHGESWDVAELPQGKITSEIPVGHNEFDGPPLLLIVRREADVNPATGTRRRSLWATLPRIEQGSLIVPEPSLVSARIVGDGGGSGDTSLAATRGDVTHLVWTESTTAKRRGGPTLVATFDRGSGVVGPAVEVARTLPANDGHARPGICLDSLGYLHVLTGGHGTSFQYVRSLVPGTPYRGWTRPQPVLTTGWLNRAGDGPERGRQTYLAFVCDQSNTLHIAFRQWRRGVDARFRGANHGTLSYQWKREGGEWSAALAVVAPPYPGYVRYFQELAVDRLGRLYLFAGCIAGPEMQARKAALARRRLRGGGGPQPPLFLRRMVLTPSSPGYSWRFATTGDFAARVLE